MIRLALSGAAETTCRDIASRLRGATLQIGLNTLPEAFDAAVFLGPATPAVAEIERLLGAGKHVLLAAESFLPGEVLERLFATTGRAGVCLEVVNPDRYLPSRRLIRQQLEAGKLGEVGLVRLHRWEVAAESPGLPAGLVRDIDLAVWLAGKLPDLVYAVAGACIQVHLGFPGGGMALIDYSGRLPGGDGYCSLSVIGSAGAAYADDHQNRQLVYQGGCPRAVLTSEGDAHLTALVQEFVDALRSHSRGADQPTSPAVIDAVSRSLASRQAVRPEGH
jgi:predicted dehydrogenase